MPSNVTLCPSNEVLYCNVAITARGSLAGLSCSGLVEGRAEGTQQGRCVGGCRQDSG